MLVLIIHLARATHRAAHVQLLKEHLQSVPGLEVRIQDAVDGHALPISKCNERVGACLARPFYPFPLNPGEVGCFLSHREAWQTFLNSPYPECLILEDDAEVDIDKLSNSLQIFRNCDASYIQLAARKPRQWPSALDLSQQSIAALRPPALGTAGQILGRVAAAQLLESTQKFDRPIDTYLQMTWHHGVNIQTLYPSMVRLADTVILQTTIQHKQRRNVFNELKRSWHRMLYRQKIRSKF